MPGDLRTILSPRLLFLQSDTLRSTYLSARPRPYKVCIVHIVSACYTAAAHFMIRHMHLDHPNETDKCASDPNLDVLIGSTRRTSTYHCERVRIICDQHCAPLLEKSIFEAMLDCDRGSACKCAMRLGCALLEVAVWREERRSDWERCGTLFVSVFGMICFR